jgi:hypothetical protein
MPKTGVTMKTVLKIIRILFGLVLLVIVGGLLYLNISFPKVGDAKNITVKSTPARLARGEYLVNNVALCLVCHAERDFSMLNTPPKPGTKGAGGQKWTKDNGWPGNFYAANITPFGIGDYTDGELVRAITTGINKDGKALFPKMPYRNYRTMDKNDLYSIVAYLRSLAPVKSNIPDRSVNFPFSTIIKIMPKEADLQPIPDRSDVVAYGRYLTTMASCNDCHTPTDDKGMYIKDKYMSGGMEFPLAGGTVRAMNITPDKETGLGEWTRDVFIDRFKMYDDSSMFSITVDKNEFNSYMPWLQYAGMKEDDLGAIFEYLQTIPAINNSVERWTEKK